MSLKSGYLRIVAVGSLLLGGSLSAQQPTQITWIAPDPGGPLAVANHTTVPMTVLVQTVPGASPAAPVPGGTVSFFDGSYLLGTAIVQFGASGQPGNATLNVSFASGSHTLTANYNGLTTATPATSFGVSSAPLVLTVTGQELVTMNCVLYGSEFPGNYTNPFAYGCEAEGFSRQTLSGVVSMTDSLNSTNPGFPFPSPPQSGTYYTQYSGAFISPPIGPIDSFITADVANSGVAGLIGVSANAVPNGQTVGYPAVVVVTLTPVSMSQETNGQIFGPYQPIPSGFSESAIQNYPVGAAPVQVVAADVNGDGNLDLVVAHNDPTGVASVGVLLGNPGGTTPLPPDNGGGFATFLPEATFGLGNGNAATNLATGDVNGDGFPDIVVTNGGNQITVLLGNGDGTFTPGTGAPIAAGPGATQIALTDLNGDGILDIAVMNVANATIGVLQGNGDGTFQPQNTNPAGTQPTAFAIGDLNNDSIPDITVAGTVGTSQGELTFLTGQPGLTYQSNYFACDLSGGGATNGQYTSIQLTDMDGDGIPDLLLGYNFSGYTVAITNPTSPFPNSNYVPGSCYPLNNDNGSVANRNSAATSSMAAADLTGNGAKDLLLIPPGVPSANMYGIVGFGSSVLSTQPVPINLGGPGTYGSRTVDFIFTPAGGSVYGAGASPTVSVTYNQLPQGRLSPSLVQLPGYPGVPVTAPVTLTNTGTAPLNVSNVSFSLNQGSVFSIPLNPCPANILPGGTCVINVTFTPTYTPSMVFEGILSITDNDPVSSPQTSEILGELVYQAVPSPSPTTLAFGSQALNSTTIDTISVFNTGYYDLTFAAPIVASNSPFLVTGGTCLLAGAVVHPGGTPCTITVSFTPTTTGLQTATVPLVAIGSSATVTLTGTGAGAPAPVVSLSQSTLAFGSQAISTTSGTQSITLTNTGTASLTIAPIGNVGMFNVVAGLTTCGTAPVAPAGTCMIVVSFSPTAATAQTATLTLTDNAVSTPPITLTGTGTSAPVISLSQSTLAFGSQAINTTSGTQSITLTNTGTASLTIAPIGNVGMFNLVVGLTTCGTAPVAPAGTCMIVVSFSPTAATAQTATLTLTDNAVSTPPITLTGTGTSAPVISLSQSTLAFGSQAISTTSGTQSITLTNTGTASLTIAPIGNVGMFNVVAGLTTCGTAPVAPAGTCMIVVSFSPTAATAQTATLTLTDNAVSTPPITLTGTGTSAPVISLSQSTLAFGSQAINTTSGTQSITLTNTGTASLTIAPIGNVGMFNLVVGLTTCGTAPVAPAGTCMIVVSFSPTAATAQTATLTLTDNAVSTPPITLTGTGTSAPVISLSQSTLAFGSQAINTTSGTQSITLTNTGTASLTIGPIGNVGMFNVVAGLTTCGTAPVAPAGTCTIVVSFSPTAATAQTATLTLADNAVSTPPITLTGTGTGTSAPVVSLSAANLAFGNQAINITSPAQTVLLSNTGSAILNITSVVASAGYAVSGTCTIANETVAAGSSCTLIISFTPGTAMPDPGTIVIMDNAVPGTQSISLTGTGTGAPVATLSTTLIAAGNGGIALSSQAGSVTLTNTGNLPLNFAATPYGLQGTGASSWKLVNQGCSGTLAPGASCSIAVYFAPTSAGSQSATLTFSDNAAAPQQVLLAGTGITPTLTMSPTALAFGTVNVGAASSQTITITNTGTVGLYIGNLSLSGANPDAYKFVSQCTIPSAGVAPGQPCTISVTFTPTAATLQTATLSIPDYAAGAPQMVTLSGTGAAPTTTLSPGSLAFGNVTAGTTSAGQIVLVTNTGTQNLTFNSISITGANATSYTTANTCGPVLPGGVCRIVVYFAPGSATALPATLSVSDNAVGSPQTVALSGTGVTGPVNDSGLVVVTSTPFTYNHATKIYSGTVTVTNTGALALNPPLYAVLTGLPAGVTATNQTGNVAAGPYYALTGLIGPGAGQTFAVTLSDPPGTLLANLLVKVYSGGVQ